MAGLPPADDVTLHATCVVLGEVGILIRGQSGCGKSSLARLLLEHVEREGGFGRLVCDDRVRLSRRHGRVVARALPSIAGRLEIRGLGLVEVPWQEAAVIRLVVDRDALSPRNPAPQDLRTECLGVPLARIAVGGAGDSADLVRLRLRDLHDTHVTRS